MTVTERRRESIRTVPGVVARAAHEHPATTALVAQAADGTTRRTTYQELDDLTAQVASGLVSRGIRPGDRVALCLDNTTGHEAVISLVAIHKARAIGVPINTRYSPDEICGALERSGATAVIGAAEVLDLVGQSGPAACTVRLDVRGDHADPRAWSRLASEGRDDLAPPGEHDDADWLFTSGTTSQPKCAMFTHAAAVATGEGVAEALDLGTGDIVQGSFPFSTSSGCHLLLLSALTSGATLVLEPSFDRTDTLRRLVEEQTTVFVAVPTVYAFLLDEPGFDQEHLPHLRLIDYGGAPMPTRDIHRLYERFPKIELRQTYGLTEAGPGGIYLPGEYALSKVGAVGIHPMGDLQFRVVDDEAGVLDGPGEGEIQYRGPSLMRGYFGDAQATRDALTDGWLRTGDIVRVDEDGVVFHLDRAKDIIIRGGFNIASIEVEDRLVAHPDVREAAVVPIPHDKLGEDVAAIVVPRAGAEIDIDALQRHCRETLADYKVPRTIVVADALPRNAMGKVLKKELRRRWENT